MRQSAQLLIGLSLAIAVTQPFSACAGSKSENEALRKTHHKLVEDYKTVSQISADSLSKMDSKTYALFDVRGSEEFAVSHIEGAIWVDPNIDADAFLNLHGDIIGNRSIVLYCSVGVRSSRLAEKIQNHGSFQTPIPIYNLELGVFGWHNDKRPLVRLSKDAAKSTEFIHPYNRWWGRMINRTKLKKYRSD